MGIQVELRWGGVPIRGLPDPAGGCFDAAGDFDRLLRERQPDCPLLSAVDPHGETSFGHHQMADLLGEIDGLLGLARPGPERRGLLRLRAMAERCGSEQQRLVFVGD
ncbi:hypothetical protein OHA21_17060 [Actinoplanes sp. NBC_00393]|uniref:hypothetical protein n=1 Tax=Actinoplanes sp. NBC_00393 TaxID=2975953 RepID=UPI002E23743E